MTMFENLLEIQRIDAKTLQLQRSREVLPERQQVVDAQRTLQELVTQHHALHEAHHQRERDLKAIDDAVALLRDKVASLDARMYGGSVYAPKELAAFQADKAMLERQINEQEDQELLLMEEADDMGGQETLLQERIRGAEETLKQQEELLAAATTSIAAELEALAAKRAPLVAEVPTELLTEYEQVRDRSGGIGIARLVGHRCQGCHLELSAKEVDRLRHLPSEEIAYCDECGRMLVRG